MSKRDLKKYIENLDKDQIADQIVELYDKFPEVKAYYDFVFRPNEDKLSREAKFKISNEYFPTKSKRPKLRRSVAQKIIKKFLLLGVDPFVTADVMLHNIEVAQKFSAKRDIRYLSFYKSLHNSFDQVVRFTILNGISSEFSTRFDSVKSEADRQKWDNSHDFAITLEELDAV